MTVPQRESSGFFMACVLAFLLFLAAAIPIPTASLRQKSLPVQASTWQAVYNGLPVAPGGEAGQSPSSEVASRERPWTDFLDIPLDSHLRISLDVLEPARERVLLQACLQAKQPVAIDGTNVTRAGRARQVPLSPFVPRSSDRPRRAGTRGSARCAAADGDFRVLGYDSPD